jgi:uncharacterized protein (DUF983 family)
MVVERQLFNLGCCPTCGSGRIRITHVEKPRRRVRCKVCGRRWVCLEIIEAPDGKWVIPVLVELLTQGRLAALPSSVRSKLLSIIAE